MFDFIAHNYLLFHSIVEIAGVVTAFSILVIYANSYRISGSGYFAFVGFGFGFVGFFDFLHTLAYQGMGVFTGNSANLATQFWIIARFLECLSILASSLILHDRLKLKLFITIYSCASVAAMLSIFTWKVFPDCYVEGVGLTPFKVICEYMISAMLLVSLFILYFKRGQLHPRVKWVIISGYACVIVSELLFTLYTSTYSLTNMLGHLFKLASLILIYRAFVAINMREPFKLIFRELELQKRTYETLFKNNINMTFIMDPKGRITSMNNAFSRLLGYGKEGIESEALIAHLPPGEIDRNREAFKNALNGETQHYETTFLKSDGSGVELEILSIPVVINGELHCIIGMCKDISEQKAFEKTILEANARLQEITNIDGLTGIKNRAYFDDLLGDEWRKSLEEGKPAVISLIMSDIDNFKSFNDNYGHLSGDICLKDVAGKQAGVMKEFSAAVARYGGEEFAVILPDIGLAEAAEMAEKVRSGVESLKIPHAGSKTGGFVTISVGVCSIVPNNSCTSGDLINKADEALYRAKQTGRNRVFVCEGGE